MSFSRICVFAFALAAVFGLAIETADAKLGRNKSFGSRGSKTYSAPPSTSTAPGAAPIQRSTQPATAQPGGLNRPGAAAAPSRFGGFGGLLIGGLLGAGLFGLLSGSGLFGGLGSFAGFLGLLLQVALIGGLVWLGLKLWRSRSQTGPAMAGANAGGSNTPYPAQTEPMQRERIDAGMNNRPWSYGGNAEPQTKPLEISPEDYQAFEKLLTNLQAAYGRGDIATLGALTTPEMLGYLTEELQENDRNGVRNEVSNAKFLDGDLSEAWGEQDADYATVAMRYSIIDAVVEKATGKLLEGDRTVPQEITEIWTFRRDHRYSAQGWQLSAIQQPDDDGNYA